MHPRLLRSSSVESCPVLSFLAVCRWGVSTYSIRHRICGVDTRPDPAINVLVTLRLCEKYRG
jgi:hypothetical protein